MIWLFATAQADPSQVAHGRYLLDTERPWAAAELAATLLEADHRDPEVHGLYIDAWTALGEGGILTAQYRTWWEQAPSDATRRTSLAWTLERTQSARGDWCEEFATLAGDHPPEILVARLADGRCPVDPVDSTLNLASATQLISQTRAAPWEQARLAVLFEPPAADRNLDAARDAARALALESLNSDQPAVISAAKWVLWRAGEHDAVDRATDRLNAIDPHPRRPNTHLNPTILAIRAALKHPNREEALLRLDAVVLDLEARGPIVAGWHRARAELLDGLGRDKEALTSRRLAWESLQSDADLAVTFALAAAAANTDLQAALTATTTALASISAQRAPLGDYNAWLEDQRSDRAAALTAQAAVLRALDRDEEARRALRASLELERTGEAHLALAALEVGALAEEHRAWGLALKDASVDGLADRKVLELAWAERPYWHPAGLDGTLAARRRAVTKERPRVPTDPSPLIGEAFPVTAFYVNRAERALSEFPGVVVVDLWATWCGPCVASMPHLDELSQRWAGHATFLGLSADDSERTVAQFLRKADPLSYTIGWAGSEVTANTQSPGLPSTFILDEDHRVVAWLQGWSGPDDHRLEEVLRHLLGHPD